jgi:hypothetical protein
MRLDLLGETAAHALAGRDTGRVLAVVRHAVYLSLPRGVIVLVEPAAEPGPLHVHVDALPRVEVGDVVRTERGSLLIAGAWIAGEPDLWTTPALPARADLARAAPTLREVLGHAPDVDLAGTAGPATETGLSALLRAAGLEAATTQMAGRGAGLTPAGDDVLAGLFLVARAVAGCCAETRLVALARAAATHEISRAYLYAAARGRSLAAVHDLIAAGVAGHPGAAKAARDRLAHVGHSSGLDLAYGVLVGSATMDTAPWLDTGRRPACPHAA